MLEIAVGLVAAGALASDYMKTPFDATFERVAASSGVPADLLRALARHESGFRPSAISPVNANGTRDYGLLQINEATARALGREVSRLTDPAYNVETAAVLLKRIRVELKDRFAPYTWVAAYNAGAPAILRRGVFNAAYASAVTWHWQMYQLATLLKGGGATA